jgi:hypothetical protein
VGKQSDEPALLIEDGEKNLLHAGWSRSRKHLIVSVVPRGVWDRHATIELTPQEVHELHAFLAPDPGAVTHVSRASGRSAGWTVRRVQQRVITTARVRCPQALAYRSLAAEFPDPAFLRNAQNFEKACQDPAEPRDERAIVACGVTSSCFLPAARITVPVDASRLAIAEKAIDYFEHGYPFTSARCLRNGTYRFTCRGRLSSVSTPGSSPGIACLAVVARRQTLRARAVEVWKDDWVSKSSIYGLPRPYKPLCSA